MSIKRSFLSVTKPTILSHTAPPGPVPDMQPRQLQTHLQLATLLLNLPPPLPVYPFPHAVQYVEKNQHDHVFSYPHPPMALQVSDLQGWGCLSVQTALDHPDLKNCVWVYIDGSWDSPQSGSASIMAWPDGKTLRLALPCPYHSSKDAKF